MHVCAPVKHLLHYTSIVCVSIFIHMGSSSRGQMLGNPQNQSWSRTIITAILIKVSHCDPLIFSQCWLHCSAVTTSITKLQPVINLHIIYMSPNQHTANPNPKIAPTRTWKTSPFVKFKHFFLPHPPIFTSDDDGACVLLRSKLIVRAEYSADIFLSDGIFFFNHLQTLRPMFFLLRVFTKYDAYKTHTHNPVIGFCGCKETKASHSF